MVDIVAYHQTVWHCFFFDINFQYKMFCKHQDLFSAVHENYWYHQLRTIHHWVFKHRILKYGEQQWWSAIACWKLAMALAAALLTAWTAWTQAGFGFIEATSAGTEDVVCIFLCAKLQWSWQWSPRSDCIDFQGLQKWLDLNKECSRFTRD